MKKKLLVLSHRGYSAIAPENTQIAFQAAQIFYFDGVELDVHLTKDDELVIIHDEDIRRTCNSEGLVSELTLIQLKKFNFASKFKVSKIINKQTIMTLHEFFVEFGNKFKVINIEVKTNVIHYKGIEEKIVKMLKQISCNAEIILSSFNFETLKILANLEPNLNLGFLFVSGEELLPVFDEVKSICKYIHPWFKSLENSKALKVYYDINLGMNLWTFDSTNSNNEWTKGSNDFYKNITKYKNIISIIGNTPH